MIRHSIHPKIVIRIADFCIQNPKLLHFQNLRCGIQDTSSNNHFI